MNVYIVTQDEPTRYGIVEYCESGRELHAEFDSKEAARATYQASTFQGLADVKVEPLEPLRAYRQPDPRHRARITCPRCGRQWVLTTGRSTHCHACSGEELPEICGVITNDQPCALRPGHIGAHDDDPE